MAQKEKTNPYRSAARAAAIMALQMEEFRMTLVDTAERAEKLFLALRTRLPLVVWETGRPGMREA